MMKNSKKDVLGPATLSYSVLVEIRAAEIAVYREEKLLVPVTPGEDYGWDCNRQGMAPRSPHYPTMHQESGWLAREIYCTEGS